MQNLRFKRKPLGIDFWIGTIVGRPLRKPTKKALESPRELLLFQGEQGSEWVNIRPILKFSKQSNDIFADLRRHWDLLTQNTTVRNFVDPNPHITFKRSCSLRDALKASHFDRQPGYVRCGTRRRGTYKCGHCDFCHNIIQVNEPFDIGPTTIQPNHFENCETKRYSLLTYVVL